MHFVEPFLFLKVDVVDGDDSDGGDGWIHVLVMVWVCGRTVVMP